MANEELVKHTRGAWLAHARYVRGESLVGIPVKHPHILLLQGMTLADNGRLQEALEKYHACAKLEPKDPEPIKLAASCLFKQGRHRLALEAYREANTVSKRPDPEILSGLAECIEWCGGNGTAWARAAVEAGGGEEASALLAKLLLAHNDQDGALQTYDLALQNHACGAETLASAGTLWLRCGDAKKAYHLLSAALVLQPNQHAAALALAAMILSHGDIDTGLIRLKSTLTSQPTSVAALSDLGLALLAKKKMVAAISCVQKACWLAPLSPKAAHNSGAVFLAANQYASAFCKLATAVAISPNPQSYLLLAITLEMLGDDRADDVYKMAEKHGTDDPFVVLNLAGRYARLGLLNESVEQLRSLATLLISAEIPNTKIAQSAAQLSVAIRDRAGLEVEAIDTVAPDDFYV